MPIDIDNDDITTALKKLKARENNLRRLEDVSGLGSWEVDLRTNKSIWSDRSYEIYGIEKGSEVSLELFFSRLIPEDLQRAQEELKRAMDTAEAITFRCKVKRTNNIIVNILINGQVIFDDNHNPMKLIGTTQDITEYVKLQEQAQELSDLIEHSSNEIYIVESSTLRYLYVNKGAVEALGYTSEELLDMTIKDVNPHLRDTHIEELEKQLYTDTHILNKTIHKRKDGTTYHVQSYIHLLTYQGKNAFVIFDIDRTEDIELELKEKKQAKILTHIHDSVVSTDLNGKITSWNNGSYVLFGYKEEEMLGKSILNIYHRDNEKKLNDIFEVLNENSKLDIIAFMQTKDSQKIVCDISLSLLTDNDGNPDGYAGYIQDITKQKEIQDLLDEQTQKLKHQAHHDPLTNLPNRTLFQDRLSQSIITAKRNNEMFALFFIDLDQFKKINDSLGHHIGDEVLVEAAKRLQSTLREEDTLSRLGGDEFTIIIKDVKHIQDASVVAQKIINVMKEPMNIDNHLLYISSSIGISIYPDDATTSNNLIKYSDAAMYKAKDEGRDNYQYYSKEMTSYAFEKVVMETSLRVAIKEEQFVVYFQPQIDTQTETIVGMEALVRWIHPSLGLVPPGNFIPLAEDSGLIIDIDKIVMKKAMIQFEQWYKDGLNPGLLSLNLAMKQLAEDNFISYLFDTMKTLNFHSEWLELEVTEGQVMHKPEASIEKLHKINKMGINLAIDDFGTGYSSLSYLKKFPLHKLKIDQSFVRDIPDDEDDVAITKAIIALGKSLNLKLIAEGVETEDQKEFLKENGCDLIQGYYYSRPIPSDEMTIMLKEFNIKS